MNRAPHFAALALLTLSACGGDASLAPGGDGVGVGAARTAAPARSDETSGNVPARIASLDPALTSLVVALGASPRLVGRTRHCTPPRALEVPVVGDLRPVPELVLAATPDLVVMADYPSQAADRAALEALGAPVLALPLVTLGDLTAATRTLGDRLGLTDRATALNTALEAALEGLGGCERHLGSTGRPPTVAIIHGLEGGFVYTTGGGDHVEGLLARAGLVNALAGHPRTARLGVEVVVAARPDVILHTAPSAAMTDSASALAIWGRFPELPAVKAGRIRVWPDDRLARNGPHLAAVAGELCNFLASGSVAGRP